MIYSSKLAVFLVDYSSGESWLHMGEQDFFLLSALATLPPRTMTSFAGFVGVMRRQRAKWGQGLVALPVITQRLRRLWGLGFFHKHSTRKSRETLFAPSEMVWHTLMLESDLNVGPEAHCIPTCAFPLPALTRRTWCFYMARHIVEVENDLCYSERPPLFADAPQEPKGNMTPAERKVLNHIIEHIERFGHVGSMEDIGETFGVTRNAICLHIKKLESYGFIEPKHPGASPTARRDLRPTDAAYTTLGIFPARKYGFRKASRA